MLNWIERGRQSIQYLASVIRSRRAEGTVINTWTYEKQSLFLISGVIDDLLSVNEQIGLSSYTQTKFPLPSQLELADCGLTIPLSSGVKIALS